MDDGIEGEDAIRSDVEDGSEEEEDQLESDGSDVAASSSVPKNKKRRQVMSEVVKGKQRELPSVEVTRREKVKRKGGRKHDDAELGDDADLGGDADEVDPELFKEADTFLGELQTFVTELDSAVQLDGPAIKPGPLPADALERLETLGKLVDASFSSLAKIYKKPVDYFARHLGYGVQIKKSNKNRWNNYVSQYAADPATEIKGAGMFP